MNVHPKFILRIRWLICGYTIFAVFKLKMASLFHIYFRAKLYHMHTQFSQLFSQNQNILRNGFSWTNIYQSCDTVTLTKRKLGNAPPIFLVSIFVSTVCTVLRVEQNRWQISPIVGSLGTLYFSRRRVKWYQLSFSTWPGKLILWFVQSFGPTGSEKAGLFVEYCRSESADGPRNSIKRLKTMSTDRSLSFDQTFNNTVNIIQCLACFIFAK